MDVSPKQVVSVAAALIPFLENDDANRALMGSNMQTPGRAADPVGCAAGRHRHGRRRRPRLRRRGHRPPHRRRRTDRRHPHRRPRDRKRPTPPSRASTSTACSKFQRSNQNTCINQRPLVRVGDQIVAGDIIADGPSTELGELALGRNALVAFMPWNGYNFEDFDPDLRAHRARRRLHLDPHRGVRGHGPRHQAGPGRNHPRHPERRRGSPAQPRRSGHRGDRRRSPAGRHPGRQGDAEGRKPDDAGRKAAARHLRRKGLRRARHLPAPAARASPARSSKCGCSTATASTRTSAPWPSNAQKSTAWARTATTSSRS